MVLRRSDTNDYPLPLLTSVGTLDGGGVSSAVVEWRQSRANPSGGQPVLMIEEVNHLQVSDGESKRTIRSVETHRYVLMIINLLERLGVSINDIRTTGRRGGGGRHSSAEEKGRKTPKR